MICCPLWKWLILLQWRKLILDIPLLHDQFYHRRDRGFAQSSVVALVESVCHPCLVWSEVQGFLLGICVLRSCSRGTGFVAIVIRHLAIVVGVRQWHGGSFALVLGAV